MVNPWSNYWSCLEWIKWLTYLMMTFTVHFIKLVCSENNSFEAGVNKNICLRLLDALHWKEVPNCYKVIHSHLSLAPDCSCLVLSSPNIQSGKVTETDLSLLAQVLSIPNLPNSILPLADTYHVTKQFEIQDGDFYFLADANQPLGLPISLLLNLSEISLLWYVIGIKVKLVIRAL